MESKIAEKYIKDFPEGVFYRSGVRHAVEIAEQEMKRKTIEVYKKNCRLYQPSCLEGERPCSGDCEYLSDFIIELNK